MESEGRAWERDLGRCPWFERAHRFPGFDPEGICDRGCYDEPACQTCEPSGGWPSHPRPAEQVDHA